jgi:hypothetical protein
MKRNQELFARKTQKAYYQLLSAVDQQFRSFARLVDDGIGDSSSHPSEPPPRPPHCRSQFRDSLPAQTTISVHSIKPEHPPPTHKPRNRSRLSNRQEPPRRRSPHFCDDIAVLFRQFCKEKARTPPPQRAERPPEPEPAPAPASNAAADDQGQAPFTFLAEGSSDSLGGESLFSRSASDSDGSEERPRESGLKALIRKVMSPTIFEAIRAAQSRNAAIPSFEKPPELQVIWEFPSDYCQMIIDAMAEWTSREDFTAIAYEACLDKMVQHFEQNPDPRAEGLIPHLESIAEEKNCSCRYAFCFQIADRILELSLDRVVGIRGHREECSSEMVR